MTVFLIGATPADVLDERHQATTDEHDPARLRLALFTDTYAPQVNGVTRTLDRLVTTVHDCGGAVRVYTAADPAATLDSQPASVQRYASRAFWAYPELRLARPPQAAVEADLRAWQPTLVHAATPFGVGMAGRWAAQALGVPLVTSYHTHFGAYARYYGLGALAAVGWPYLRWFHNGGLRTLCPTSTVARELAGRGFERTAVWGRGVDAHRFHPRHRSAAMRARLGADDDTVIVAYVGRLAREKGLDLLFAAAHRVAAESRRHVVFTLAGDGPDAARCRRRAPASTVFTGRLAGAELSAFYASADLFVFPSTTDTFGNVVLEAMASGVPVLAVDAGSTRELLGDGCGAFVRPADPAMLAQRLLWLIEERTVRDELAARALTRARGRGWNAVFVALLAEYAAAQAVHHATHQTARDASRVAADRGGGLWATTRVGPLAARSPVTASSRRRPR